MTPKRWRAGQGISEELGASRASTVEMANGMMPHEKMLRSIERLGSKVIPRVDGTHSELCTPLQMVKVRLQHLPQHRVPAMGWGNPDGLHIATVWRGLSVGQRQRCDADSLLVIARDHPTDPVEGLRPRRWCTSPSLVSGVAS
jgi:hypothetical protein